MMKKRKFIVLNAIIWPIAFAFIVFDDYLLAKYYRLSNGSYVELDNHNYKLSDSAFIIGKTNSGNLGVGIYNKKEIISVYVRKGAMAEIEELSSILNNEVVSHSIDSCSFIRRKSENPNLPYLSWFNIKTELYYTINDEPDFQVNDDMLCNLMSM